MQKYYEDLGPNAWQEELVPYQITSNKLLAYLYSALINALIYDELNLNSDLNEPFYILELGAGHGKFSFYILKFLEFFNSFSKYKIIYIASDISQQNIDYWQQHINLQHYINNNQLDFAKFNPVKDQNIYLINSKITIKKHSLNKPIFVIANYVFDTLPHDAFQCKDSNLLANNIDIQCKKNFSFKNLKYKYKQQPIINQNYYKQQIYNNILNKYQQILPNGSFLLPVGALSAIDNIKLFSNSNTVFLVADKGNTALSDFIDLEDPNIAEHGSISFMVNFHAIKTYFELTNGNSVIMPNTNTDLQIALFMSDTPRTFEVGNFIAKKLLADINPQYLINLCYTDHNINNWQCLDQILAVLTISKWDPDLFYDLADQLLNFIDKSIKKKIFNVEQEQTILIGLELVWDYFFKLEKNQDLPFMLANIYYSLEKFELATKFFKISIQEFGASKEALYNIKLCNEALGVNI